MSIIYKNNFSLHKHRPFVIKAMVDQIAAMLNYFLKQLLGPKSKDLNVSITDLYCL